MRTTLTLDDEIFDMAKHLAEQRRISLSEAVNLLIRRGLNASSARRERNGFAIFAVSPGAAKFGIDDVQTALSEEDSAFSSDFFRQR